MDSPKQEPLPEGSGGTTPLLEARLPLGFLCKVEVDLPAHFTTSESDKPDLPFLLLSGALFPPFRPENTFLLLFKVRLSCHL